MIKINRIKPPKCRLYSPDGKFLGVINEYEFYDIRVQIKKEQIDGYYCVFKINNQPYYFFLDKDGKSSDWTNGTFDLIEKSLVQLFKH